MKDISIAKAARMCGISDNVIYYRMNRKGMTLEQALAAGPVRQYGVYDSDGSLKYMYPVLAEYMVDHKLSMLAMAKKCHIGRETLVNILLGFSNPRKNSIDAILQVTGMTYEEVFKTE